MENLALDRQKRLAALRGELPQDESNISSNIDDTTVESQVKQLLAETLEITEDNDSKAQVSIKDLTPKRVNWDLKRDLQPKLDILEGETQKAIIEIIKRRIEGEENETKNKDT